MDEIFSAPDAYFQDMWWKISEGIKRRGKERVKLLAEARKMLKDYTELRDHQVLEWEFGTDRYLEKVRELRLENAGLQSELERAEAENERLTTELEEVRSLYSHMAERYDEENECDISELTSFLNLKEKNESPASV